MNNSASQPSAGVLLPCGPSGAGKSRLAAEWLRGYGWPTVELDDFYREGTDPSLPRSSLGLPDWDDVESWDRESALSARVELCGRGEPQIPRYVIAASTVRGHTEYRLKIPPPWWPKESSRHISSSHWRAWAHRRLCIRDYPWLTFGKRFARDVRQGRKPFGTLRCRGDRLRRAEPGIVAAQELLGATAMSGAEAHKRAGEFALSPSSGKRTTDERQSGSVPR